MAAYLGLPSVKGAPVRVCMADVFRPGHPLPDDVIYIGHSHFSHRQPTTKWRSPFITGRDGSPAHVAFRFLHWLPTSQLSAQLSELAGKRLACDCQPNELCHGDVLVGAFCAQKPRAATRASPQSRLVRRVLFAAAAGLQIPAGVAQPLSQACFVSAAHSVLLGQHSPPVKWPHLEDLINDPLVLAFPRWLDSSSKSSAGSLGPTAQGTACLMAQRAGAAEQATAINKRTALPPVVPFGCDPDEHFAQSVFVQRHGTPLDWESPVGDDVRFAAACMAMPLSELQARRENSLSWFEELARRLAPVSTLAPARQHPDVAAVNPQVHLALLAALVVLLAWPDTSFVHGLCAGFPAVGYCHPCGVWPAKPGSLCTLDEALQDGLSDARRLLPKLRENVDSQVALEAGDKDEELGFCHPSQGWEELLGQSRPFRLIRRFVITQSTGKKRCIDDALASRQSEFSSDCNKLQFCSALQPCYHVQALASAMSDQGVAPPDWPCGVHTSGEDLPHAYRKIPMLPDHSWACVVAYFDPEKGCPRFRRYRGMLFGLPLAVSAFNRLPMLMQAVVRRLFFIMVSLYFDDLTQQDWSALAARSQDIVGRVFELCGYPFASDKRQTPDESGDFLGLLHDLSAVRTTGLIKVWVRQRLVDKIHDLMDTAQSSGSLRPGQASKLFGCLTFLDQGAFGRVARSGLNAIKDRQYTLGDVSISSELSQAFDTVRTILRLRPERLVAIKPQAGLRVLVASDAAQDGHRVGSGAFLLLTPRKQRLGAVVVIDDSAFDLWDAQETKIAQLELLMVFQSLLTFPSAFRGTTGVYFIDKIAALMALVKGRSDSPELDAIAQSIHMLLFCLHCSLWFEWIPSKSNWSDAISRQGLNDPWFAAHHFRVHISAVPVFLWRFSLSVRTCIFQFLS